MMLRRNYKVLVLLILMMLTASLRAAAPAAFRGRVVDAVTGEWLMGVTEKTMPQGPAVQTDEHGVFVLPLELAHIAERSRKCQEKGRLHDQKNLPRKNNLARQI